MQLPQLTTPSIKFLVSTDERIFPIMLSMPNTLKDRSECQNAWDQENSAADDAASAAKPVIRCVEGLGHN